MNKKIIALLSVFFIIISFQVTSFAQETAVEAENQNTESATYTLSLEKAIEMAKKSSPVLEVCDVNKKNLQIQKKSAAIAQKESKNVPVYANTNFELAFVKNGYYVRALSAQIVLADYEKEKAESSLAYDVTQKYFGYKNALRLSDLAGNALLRAQENEKLVKTQFDMGMCTKSNVDYVSLAVEQCRATLEKYSNNAEMAAMALKIVLGVEDDAVLVLTDEIDSTVLEADFENDLKTAMTSRYDVNALKTASELAEDYFSIARTMDNESTTYFSAYTSHIQSKHDYSTGLKNIALAVKNSYYSACDAVNQANLAGKKLDIMKTDYEATKLKTQMGMMTNLELSAKSDELTECEITYENALLAQKLAVEKYYYDIKIGL